MSASYSRRRRNQNEDYQTYKILCRGLYDLYDKIVLYKTHRYWSNSKLLNFYDRMSECLFLRNKYTQKYYGGYYDGKHMYYMNSLNEMLDCIEAELYFRRLLY